MLIHHLPDQKDNQPLQFLKESLKIVLCFLFPQKSRLPDSQDTGVRGEKQPIFRTNHELISISYYIADA